MRIVPTASAPSQIPRFARLQVDAWGHLYPKLTVERAESDLRTDPERDPAADMSSLCRAWFALDEDGGAMGGWPDWWSLRNSASAVWPRHSSTSP